MKTIRLALSHGLCFWLAAATASGADDFFGTLADTGKIVVNAAAAKEVVLPMRASKDARAAQGTYLEIPDSGTSGPNTGSWLLEPRAILDWSAFCSRVSRQRTKGKSTPGGRLWDLLSQEGRKAVDDAAKGGALTPSHKGIVVKCLNDGLKRLDLYTAESFATVAISQKTGRFLGSMAGLSPIAVQWTNRMLLEESFPDDISQGHAAFEFEVKDAGKYFLHVRVWWPDACGNSLFVFVGGKKVWIEDQTMGHWHWVKARGKVFKLVQGKQTLKVACREDGARFDQVLMLKKPPKGEEPCVPVGIED